ncbi:MAG: O-antigen ligase domain-containing protein [Gammaproteobacteria bacterium]|nr:O-antigen ligase domain-containing protein [Gammaproteobacteria bacterium]
MDTQTTTPANFEERVVAGVISATYLFYLLGALYLLAPAIAWLLLLRLVWLRSTAVGPWDDRRPVAIPLPLWIWVGGILVMLLALVVGHLDFNLGPSQLTKSTVGWAKGWALLAVFPLLGCLRIRPEMVYRAACHVGLHTLLLLPIFIGAWLTGLPQTIYVSPLEIVGGPGPEFFAVSLYEIDPGSGTPRWRLFTPWAPALGFVGNIYFVFAQQEQSTRWRCIGLTGSLAMILMSQSRLALVAVVFVWFGTRIIAHIGHQAAPFVAAGLSTALGLTGVWLIEAFERFSIVFRAARAGSTRVREALARIALERWRSEAAVWGHGIVERGPHLVEFMPIGSHHTWYGLLFVKGLVGFTALAIPLLVSLLQMAFWSGRVPLARTALAMLLLLVLYTFGENLEILAYLIWPALLIIGSAHARLAEAARATRHSSIADHQPVIST